MSRVPRVAPSTIFQLAFFKAGRARDGVSSQRCVEVAPLAPATAKSGRSGAHRATNRKLHLTLERVIAIISSRTQGCTYCTAHSSYGANQLGVDAKKTAAVFEFETSPLFTDAERAVLRVAWYGALQPNAVTNEDFEALKAHFSDREIVETVAVL